MAGFWMGKQTQERMDLWLTRVLVLVSFVAHLTLALLAGIRRCRDSGMRRSLVWLAYHMTEIGTPVALGKVFIDTTTAYREQQMFGFWAPFLLLHLGRPDNITSYALENKGLSLTQKSGLVLGIGGAIYGSYKQTFMQGDGALRAAFFIMLFFGSYKYVERAVALRRASFANIRRSCSNKKKYLRRFSIEEDGKDDALLDAHGLLDVTMGSFVEYQVNRRLLARYRYGTDYSGWKGVSKVVEMEASLMYDLLYTKASVIHTWGGYIIRFASPPATATALYLFHSKEGQALESADRTVTYILLVGTLVLDVGWLLRALGSTWTYVFLVDRQQGEEESVLVLLRRARTLWANSPWPGRLKQAGRRAVRRSWYWFHRLLISLDSSRLSLSASGVGQRNLLYECSTTRPSQSRLEKMIFSWAGLGKKIDVKDELLEVMCTYLVLELDTIVGMHPTREVNDYVRPSDFCFERNLIALHVTTDIFLLCRPTLPGIESKTSAKYEKKIRALSDYMMFLLAQRQHMVLQPGDEGIHYKRARVALKEIWHAEGTSGFQTTREYKLANILLEMYATQGSHRKASLLSDKNDSLALGADWALKLLHELEPASYGSGRHPLSIGYVSRLDDFILVFTDEAQTIIKRHRDRGERSKLLNYMLKLILDSWVRFLTFTSIQCSRESHAKQLSCGGELLTIVWLMKQHGELNVISKRE